MLQDSKHETTSGHLSHGTSLSAQVSLGTLGKLLVQHGSITGKSNGSEDEEGQGKLLSAGGRHATGQGGASSADDNLTGLVIVSGRNGRDEIADKSLVLDLVIVVLVGDVSVVETVGGFTLAGLFVEFLADFGGLGVLIVVVVVLVLPEAGGNAVTFGEGLLEEVVGELHGGCVG
jgi:hypothetical protein